MGVGDAVEVRLRRFVIDEFNILPELPAGWLLLGVELVARRHVARQADGHVEHEPSEGQGAQ